MTINYGETFVHNFIDPSNPHDTNNFSSQQKCRSRYIQEMNQVTNAVCTYYGQSGAEARAQDCVATNCARNTKHNRGNTQLIFTLVRHAGYKGKLQLKGIYNRLHTSSRNPVYYLLYWRLSRGLKDASIQQQCTTDTSQFR